MSSQARGRKPYAANRRAALGIRGASRDIGQALALLLFRERLMAGVGRIAGTGGVENFFDAGEP